MNKRYFDLAKKLSNKSTHHQHKIGAVIVKKNRVISVGFNKLKTSPRSNHPWKSIHSELDAILDVPRKDLKGSSIYVYREKRDGSLAMARPCEFCLQLIKEVGIDKLYYTGYNSYKTEVL